MSKLSPALNGSIDELKIDFDGLKLDTEKKKLKILAAVNRF